MVFLQCFNVLHMTPLDCVTSLLLGVICVTILPKSRMFASMHDRASNRSHVKINSALVDM